MLKLIKNAPRRLIRATGFSLEGLAAALRKEEAFRLELLGFALLLIILALSPWPLWKKFALAAVYTLIPLAEILNSAVEDICDLVSPEKHPLVKSAKDKGSAAVLLAIIVNCLALFALLLI